MSVLTVFKSRAAVMGYCFKSGKVVHFINGMYATSSKDEIEELTTECENGHPNYFIDADQTTIDSELLDPIAALRAQIREEERAKLIAATGNPLRDMGSTSNERLGGIANSHSINGLQAFSETQAAAAQTAIPAGTIKVGAAPSVPSTKK